jgi:hypothetical protein
MKALISEATRNRSAFCSVVLLLISAGSSGCRRAEETAPERLPDPASQTTSIPPRSPEVEMSVGDFLKHWPFVENKERGLGMLHAWARVPNNAHYRVAQKSDFENPFMTSDYGELAGAYGLAMLIVDKTATSPKRMSLIIFLERPANRSDIYWIYRDMDLSKYRMSRSSGDIFVDEVHEDGSKSVCEIQWDKDERRWTCKGR